ncbi:MAG: hypothetical protein ACTS8H_00070 [Arsenophonus sp. NC-PE1-MAG3]
MLRKSTLQVFKKLDITSNFLHEGIRNPARKVIDTAIEPEIEAMSTITCSTLPC